MSRYRRSLADGATFFFTVNLADRRSHLLTDEIDRLRHAWRTVREQHPFEDISACILPDHIHTIWQLPNGDADFGKRWGNIKRQFSKGLPAAESRTVSKIAKREKGIWQRRFWEHQIRDDLDLQRHVDYIHHNPVKHGYVKCAQDWPHSSFHRYVRESIITLDWGEAETSQANNNHGFGE
jgi:putative transposase